MKNEFVLAFNEMLDEKQLPRETVIKALESAMVSAYRKAVVASAAQHVEALLDPETGGFKIFAEKEVVDSVMDERTEVTLENAQKVEPEAQIGDMVVVESTPADFGRVAAQTARQVIQQRIRDAERQDQMDYYGKEIGEIVSGVVQSITGEGLTIGLEKKAEGTILRKDMIRGERFRMHDRVRALVVEVKDNSRSPQILLSRTHRDFLRRLLEDEVPEIFHGIVEIRSITREPGERAKIAVSATQSGIDPVGACVGLRGVRIQTIVRELHDEKIDVIEWNPDPMIFIAKAISPARVVGVYLGEGKNATVVVPEDQLSLAIGRDGQNVRLAAKLTGWRIDIKSILESAADILHLYDTDGKIELHTEEGEVSETITKEELFANEDENVEMLRVILAKKSEGRNLSTEENDMMNRFVDLIEKRKSARIHASTVSSVLAELAERDLTNEEVHAYPMAESGLPKYASSVLVNGGFVTFGDIYQQMKTDPNEVFKLQGITAKIMNEIAAIVNFVGMYDSQPAEEEVSEEIIEETLEDVGVTEHIADEPVEKLDVTETLETEPFVDLTELPTEQVEVVETVEADNLDDVSFDELFNAARPEITNPVFYVDDDEEKGGSKDKKKKKKKNVEVEYDDENDATVVRRKHKRGDDESWGW